MKVSVIIPTYNRPKALYNTLAGLKKQTIKPCEVIIVNDNSTSKYPIKELTNKFNKDFTLKYMKNPENKGACHSRNRGADLSVGDILMFLDDDDIWKEDKIEKHLTIFSNNKNVGLVYSGRDFVYDDNTTVVVKKQNPRSEGMLYPSILTRNFIGPTSSVSIKRAVFFAAGKFDEDFPAMQDYDLWIRCCKLTAVKHDNSRSLIYSISRKNDQISGKSSNHKQAIKVFLKKYKYEIKGLGFFKRRKTLASRHRSVAISMKRTNYYGSLRWTLKTIYFYPRVQDVLLLLPPKIEGVIRRVMNRGN